MYASQFRLYLKSKDDRINEDMENKKISTPRSAFTGMAAIYAAMPQSNSCAGGITLLFISGMQVQRTIEVHSFDQWELSWIFFLTTMLGGIATSLFAYKWSKMKIYFHGVFCLFISGALDIFIQFEKDKPLYKMSGRGFAGFSFGLIYMNVLSHTAENSMAETRGQFMACESFIIFAGHFLACIFQATIPIHLTDYCFGSTVILLSVLAGILTKYLHIESIPYLIHNDLEQHALHTMLNLYSNKIPLAVIRELFDEKKAMVFEYFYDDANPFHGENKRAFFLILLIAILTHLAEFAFYFGFNDEFRPKEYMILHGFTTGFALLVICGIDRWFYRRRPLLFLAITSGLLNICIGLGAILTEVSGIFYIMHIVSCVFQAATIACIEAIGYIYKSEAFAMNKKPWSLTIILIFEELLQGAQVVPGRLLARNYQIFSIASETIITIMLMFSGGLMVLIGLCLINKLPETHGLTLRQCQQEFRAPILWCKRHKQIYLIDR